MISQKPITLHAIISIIMPLTKQDLSDIKGIVSETITEVVAPAFEQLGEKVDRNGEAIEKNREAIEKNREAIDKNREAIEKNRVAIRSLEHSVDRLDSRIASLEQRVTTLENDVREIYLMVSVQPKGKNLEEKVIDAYRQVLNLANEANITLPPIK